VGRAQSQTVIVDIVGGRFARNALVFRGRFFSGSNFLFGVLGERESRIRMVALVNAADAVLEARKRREPVVVGSEIQNALVSGGGFASNFGTHGDDTRTSRIVSNHSRIHTVLEILLRHGLVIARRNALAASIWATRRSKSTAGV
jgi:hypothetical protein